MKKLLFIISMLLLFPITKAWNLEWVDIISREDRGADESLRFYDREEYKDILEKREEYKKYLQELHDSDYTKYLEEAKSSIINEKRNEFVLENNPDSIRTDKTLETYEWNELWWPNSYRFDKESIVVHHTDNDYDRFETEEEVRTFLRNIYRSHAMTNWWGDLWYNFVIDHFGNIYEWRSGWSWVVGAHASWNNVTSVWISLIWNFDKQQPTKEQINSLIELSTAISNKYDINPLERRIYNKPWWDEPYIQKVTDYSIVWHRDIWNTSCPWANLYEILPQIREVVSDNKNNIQLAADIREESRDLAWYEEIPQRSIESNSTQYIWWDSQEMSLSVDWQEVINCYTESSNIAVNDCYLNNWNFEFELYYLWSVASGEHTIILETDKEIISYDLTLLWQKDLDKAVEASKTNFKETVSDPTTGNRIQKIEKEVDTDSAMSYLDKNVQVLLYELTTDYDNYDISCSNTCSIEIQWNFKENISDFSLKRYSDSLEVKIWDESYYSEFIDIYNNWWLIQFDNYSRESYGWTPWNKFRWNIHIKKDYIKHLWEETKNDWVIINNLPFYDYMKWVVETNDQEHMQKNKIMALISKNYMLFYFDKWNEHPSIPKASSYNAVDDARIFQKYAWAWVENTITKWYDALEKTWDEIVVFDDHIPILPYYNCSAWFTWSWEERFWWTDTPYLQSKLDFVSCDDFKWHWVWLSWRWAEYLANRWISYESILRYYYDWVQILNN